MDILKLRKPLLVNGKEKKELKYDFEELTAQDMDRAGKYLKDDGSYINVAELDAGYHYKIFCIAVMKQDPEISVTDMSRLSGVDYLTASRRSRDFFIGNSAELSQEATSDT